MIRTLCIVLSALAIGCAVNKPATTKPDCCAECLVCKHNADLACVDVVVTGDTPNYVYQGTRYYFCSNSCRDEFAENPGKYLP